MMIASGGWNSIGEILFFYSGIYLVLLAAVGMVATYVALHRSAKAANGGKKIYLTDILLIAVFMAIINIPVCWEKNLLPFTLIISSLLFVFSINVAMQLSRARISDLSTRFSWAICLLVLPLGYSIFAGVIIWMINRQAPRITAIVFSLLSIPLLVLTWFLFRGLGESMAEECTPEDIRHQ